MVTLLQAIWNRIKYEEHIIDEYVKQPTKSIEQKAGYETKGKIITSQEYWQSVYMYKTLTKILQEVEK